MDNLFKTRLCNNFMDRGVCINRGYCNFAHGNSELRHRDGQVDNNKVFRERREESRFDGRFTNRTRDLGPPRMRSQSPPPPRRRVEAHAHRSPSPIAKKQRAESPESGERSKREEASRKGNIRGKWKEEYKRAEDEERRRLKRVKAQSEADRLEGLFRASTAKCRDAQARAAALASHVDHAQRNLTKLDVNLKKLVTGVKQVARQQDELKRQEQKLRKYVSILGLDFEDGDVEAKEECGEEENGEEEEVARQTSKLLDCLEPKFEMAGVREIIVNVGEPGELSKEYRKRHKSNDSRSHAKATKRVKSRNEEKTPSVE
mmetsp:Transcript_12493/g.17028  ORF Transcript_12493/g.17028 Transcript_12493/m.17028 type:complete len:317 (-) Transcript_12493:29-979(-)